MLGSVSYHERDFLRVYPTGAKGDWCCDVVYGALSDGSSINSAESQQVIQFGQVKNKDHTLRIKHLEYNAWHNSH